MALDEFARRDRFCFANDRRQFTLTRGFIRTLLSQYLGGDPAAWKFSANRYGRPRVANAGPAVALEFNLSHAPGLIVCALCRWGEIGVDVELLERTVERGIVTRFFSPVEVAALDGVGDAEFNSAFLAYWTAKEAYIKARGAGLSLPLDAFSMTFDSGRPTIAFSERLSDDARTWQFMQTRIGHSHLLALAVRCHGADRRVRVRPFDPKQLGVASAHEA